MVKQANEKRRKWIDYFDLLDALKISGCPLCNRINIFSLRFLDNLFYERVTDVGTRVNLAKAKGFCNWHAWMSMEIPNSGSGIAIIYKDLLDAEIREISEWEGKRDSSDRSKPPELRKRYRSVFLSSWAKKASCPICEWVKEHERFEMGTLLDFIDEEAFSQEFGKSSGICIRHLILIMEGFDKHPNLSLLVEKQVKKYQSLSDELGEFIRKLDYRFSKEPKGSEAASWKRVIEQFSGKREVFGNGMDHKK
jgi:hypothetical protein